MRPSYFAFLGAALALSACAPRLPLPASGEVPLAARAQHLPADLRGITYDDLSSTCAATPVQLETERLLESPTIRVVFDRVPPSCYATGVPALDRYGYTMGELIDSSDMKRYTLPQVRKRVAAYVAALGGAVDIWEIGNEVNGEWLSTVRCPGGRECPAQARDVVDKVQAMYDAVDRAGYPTELTLYYEPSQTVTPGYDMISWEQTYIPASMHAGLRYVLVSYYEVDNRNIRPSQGRWETIFKQLSADFPNAEVGFGEIGLNKPIVASTLTRATSIFNYYQGLAFPDIPAYTRAGFWWNAAEDLVPSTKWPGFFRDVRRNL